MSARFDYTLFFKNSCTSLWFKKGVYQQPQTMVVLPERRKQVYNRQADDSYTIEEYGCFTFSISMDIIENVIKCFEECEICYTNDLEDVVFGRWCCSQCKRLQCISCFKKNYKRCPFCRNKNTTKIELIYSRNVEKLDSDDTVLDTFDEISITIN